MHAYNTYWIFCTVVALKYIHMQVYITENFKQDIMNFTSKAIKIPSGKIGCAIDCMLGKELCFAFKTDGLKCFHSDACSNQNGFSTVDDSKYFVYSRKFSLFKDEVKKGNFILFLLALTSVLIYVVFYF